MDGYAVRAEDTFGATESLPAYLTVIGEVPMGRAVELTVGPAQAAVVLHGRHDPRPELMQWSWLSGRRNWMHQTSKCCVPLRRRERN